MRQRLTPLQSGSGSSTFCATSTKKPAGWRGARIAPVHRLRAARDEQRGDHAREGLQLARPR